MAAAVMAMMLVEKLPRGLDNLGSIKAVQIRHIANPSTPHQIRHVQPPPPLQHQPPRGRR